MVSSKKISKNKVRMRLSSVLILMSLAASAQTVSSHFQIKMMIDGNTDENAKIVNKKKQLNHRELRNAYKISKMTPIERKMERLSERIRMEKIHKNDRKIYKLRKMLGKVKVFRTSKQIEKMIERKALMMLMYQPEKLAEVQKQINKRDRSKNGKSLLKLIKKQDKKKKAKNPFQGIVDVQSVIDEAVEPKKAEIAEENEEVAALLRDEGMYDAD